MVRASSCVLDLDVVGGGVPGVQRKGACGGFHGYAMYTLKREISSDFRLNSRVNTESSCIHCSAVAVRIRSTVLFQIRRSHPMSQHAALPARYDHVGSFLRPKYLLEAREQKAKGEITPEQLRKVEDKAITEIVKFQEDIGLQEHHRRRVPPHLLPHRLPRAARRREDRHPGHHPQARRHRRTGAAGDARDRQGAPRQGHPAGRLPVPQEPGVAPATRPR